MENIDKGIELHIRTKMGYVKVYGRSTLQGVMSYANKRQGDDISRLLIDGRLIYAGKISNMIKQTVGV
jgi:hypothetical protein